MQSTPSHAENIVQYINLPNAISSVRLLAAPVLVALATWDLPAAFLGLALVLLLTDWVDGRIARAWNQQSVFGARLDAFSDVAIYVCIAWGIALLRPEQFWTERYWLILVLGSYLLSIVVCLAKFGCFPNYHTRTAKLSWLLATVGVIVLLMDISVWPLRLAFAVVTLANFESMAITLALHRWRVDVASLAAAMRRPDAPDDAMPDKIL